MISPGHAMTDLGGRFLSVDDQFCEILSRERPEIIGRTIIEVTVNANRRENLEKLSRLCERREAFTIRKSYISGDRSLVKVQNHVNVITDGLGGDRIVATVIPTFTKSPSIELNAALESAKKIAIGRRLQARHLREISEPNVRWDLLLTVYILEAEGRSTISFEVCAIAHVDESIGIISLWEMIAAKYLTAEGNSLNLREIGLSLTQKGSDMITDYLQNLRETGVIV